MDMDRDMYWLQSRVDRVQVNELRTWLRQAGPENLLDLQEVLTILEAPLHDDIRALLVEG